MILFLLIGFLLISFSMRVEESLSHSFQETNVDKTGLDASDNETSSSVELVNAIDSIFGMF